MFPAVDLRLRLEDCCFENPSTSIFLTLEPYSSISALAKASVKNTTKFSLVVLKRSLEASLRSSSNDTGIGISAVRIKSAELVG